MSIRIIPEATRITDNNNRIASMVTDADGNDIINIHDADFHRTVINERFQYNTGSSDYITANASAGDYSIVVSSSFFDVLNVGDYLKIAENGTREVNHPFIAYKTSSPAITLNKPIDNNYTTSASIEVIDLNLASTAVTFSSPRVYSVGPPVSSIWHIMRYFVSITDNNQPDDGNFGGIPSLSNGVTLRENTAIRKYTMTNWRSNADMVKDMYDVDYRERGGGGGTWGTRGRWSPGERAEAIVYLDGTSGDTVEAIVHDDMTALIRFELNAQGHYEGE